MKNEINDKSKARKEEEGDEGLGKGKRMCRGRGTGKRLSEEGKEIERSRNEMILK